MRRASSCLVPAVLFCISSLAWLQPASAGPGLWPGGGHGSGVANGRSGPFRPAFRGAAPHSRFRGPRTARHDVWRARRHVGLRRSGFAGFPGWDGWPAFIGAGLYAGGPGGVAEPEAPPPYLVLPSQADLPAVAGIPPAPRARPALYVIGASRSVAERGGRRRMQEEALDGDPLGPRIVPVPIARER